MKILRDLFATDLYALEANMERIEFEYETKNEHDQTLVIRAVYEVDTEYATVYEGLGGRSHEDQIFTYQLISHEIFYLPSWSLSLAPYDCDDWEWKEINYWMEKEFYKTEFTPYVEAKRRAA